MTKSKTTEAAQHTPGPWALYVQDKNDGYIGRVSTIDRFTGKPYPAHAQTQGVPVARVYDNLVSRDVAEANARLIAAAPDLLEAARLTVAAYKPNEHCPFLTALRAAIAKAEGR
jgi:hypothetical protein